MGPPLIIASGFFSAKVTSPLHTSLAMIGLNASSPNAMLAAVSIAKTAFEKGP